MIYFIELGKKEDWNIFSWTSVVCECDSECPPNFCSWSTLGLSWLDKTDKALFVRIIVDFIIDLFPWTKNIVLAIV